MDDESALPQYQYRSLNDGHIRVLALEPGIFGDVLRARLIHVTLTGASETLIGVDGSCAHSQRDHEQSGNEPGWFHVDATPHKRHVRTSGPMKQEDSNLEVADEQPFSMNGTSQETLRGELGQTSKSADKPQEVSYCPSLWNGRPQQMRGYEALSYAWGPAVSSKVIIIDGEHHLMITESLYNALQYTRSRKSPRTLWADAICINQGDIEEISVQVSIMRSIYQEANQVWVWLGEREQLDWLAIAMIEIFPENMNYRWIGDVLQGLRPQCRCCKSNEFYDHKKAFLDAVDGLKSISARPWFQRLWVVQESTVARKVWLQIGWHVLDNDKLEAFLGQALHNLRPYSETHPERFALEWETFKSLGQSAPCLQDMRTIRLAREHYGLTALRAVWLTWERKCKDPRDRVYALQGLPSSDYRFHMLTDYSLPYAKVWSHFTFCILSSTFTREGEIHPAGLLAMTKGSLAQTPDHSLPTWIPDLQKNSKFCADLLIDRYTILIQDVLFHSELGVRTGRNDDEISMRGRVTGEIIHILASSQIDRLHTWRYFHEEDSVSPDKQVDPKVIVEWLLRCGKFMQSHQTTITDPTFLQYDWVQLEQARQLWTLMRLSTWSSQTKVLAEKAIEILLACDEVGLLRKDHIIAAVDTDHEVLVGWVPENALPGDSLCIIYGAPYPFVIRRCPETDAYQIIGDATFLDLLGKTKAPEGSNENQWLYVR